MKFKKTPKMLERHFKGVANHWRIRILQILAASAGMSLEELCAALGGNVKTISEHTRKLSLAGLIEKKYQGRSVIHTLTAEGRTLQSFLQSF